MKFLLPVTALALAGCTLQLPAITVSTPSSGATVTSPFVLTASAQTCGSVPTASMAYSIDSGTDVIEPASFTATVQAPIGSHVVHVKCWGMNTFDQVLLNINVAAPAPVSNITIQSPSNGATLSSPFTLTASASTCASKPAVSMGYSIDSGTTTIEPTSFTASVTSSPGAHVLHVKCWGQSVNDQVLINLNIVASPAATPVFSLSSGTYNSSQAVAISSPTPGASVYFTTDGSAPSTASTLYTGPITVAKTTTIQAIAVASGYLNSGVGRASYTISIPAAIPILSLPSGTYNSSQSIAMSTSTPGASIYFTTDGTAPSTSSAVYSGPITISKTATVQAIAVAPGYQNSGIASASYTISLPAALPTFSLASGTYNSSQTVAITSPTTGASIYFTMDGSAPSTASSLYSGPITISKTATVQAIAVASGYQNSGIASASYTISIPKGPQIPSYAHVDQQLDLLPNWRIKQDPAMPGTSTGAMSLVSDPTLTGQAAKYYTTFTNGGGTLYSVSYGNDTDSTNFVYDVYVWIASGSVIANLEMDNNQVMRNGDTVIYAFQCSGYSNTWEFTENSGTRESPQAHWLKSTQPCNPAKWTRDAWHHIQIQTSRDDFGNVTYHSVWFDGVEAPINQTVNSDFSLGWALGALVANFQVDGLGTSGSSIVYVDNLMMSRW